VFFTAAPTNIRAGQASTLSWRVLNADEVSISPVIGSVAADGTSSVSPQETTTYRLTARNATSEENATATVVVEIAQTRVFGCSATPTNIAAGEAATISFSTENATGISVSPSVPSVPVGGGSFVVTPTTTTTYTITVTGAGNQTSSCAVTVTVSDQQAAPRIVRFTAAPTQVVSGESSTLVWQVENADTVTISPTVGDVPLSGTQDVTPTADTTYTLTATNAAGTTTATASVSVTGGAQITSFTANPPTSPAPGSTVVLTCLAENATSVTVAGAGPLVNGSVVVRPTVDTTYTCTAVGTRSQDTRTLTVTVTQPEEPPPPAGPPPTVVIAGAPVIESVVRTVVLDASQSFSPAGFGPLRYLWTSRDGRGGIANATSPTPTVYLGNLFGEYFFDVTVTDARGNVSVGSITVKLVVTRIP
jgi:hypothetical protein